MVAVVGAADTRAIAPPNMAAGPASRCTGSGYGFGIWYNTGGEFWLRTTIQTISIGVMLGIPVVAGTTRAALSDEHWMLLFQNPP